MMLPKIGSCADGNNHVVINLRMIDDSTAREVIVARSKRDKGNGEEEWLESSFSTDVIQLRTMLQKNEVVDGLFRKLS